MLFLRWFIHDFSFLYIACFDTRPSIGGLFAYFQPDQDNGYGILILPFSGVPNRDPLMTNGTDVITNLYEWFH